MVAALVVLRAPRSSTSTMMATAAVGAARPRVRGGGGVRRSAMELELVGEAGREKWRCQPASRAEHGIYVHVASPRGPHCNKLSAV